MSASKNIFRAISGLASVALAFAGIAASSVPAQAAGTAASISNVSFRAPVHTTYNHITGGGAWNDGSTTYVKGELLGTDFKCGDVTTYLAQIVTPSSNPAPVTAEFKFDFLGDSTGTSGVALQPLLDADHLKVNSGVIAQSAGLGSGGTDGGFVPAGYGSTTTAAIDRSVAAPTSALVDPAKPLFTSGSSTRTTFRVTGIAANKTNIIRMDARILCQNGSRPTGNLQVSLFSVVVGPGTTNETISGGNQTVNFRGVGNLGGLVTPELTVTKTVVASGTNCANGVASATVNVPATVTYCVSIANYSAATAANVRLKDDNGTPSNTADDFYVPLTYNGITSTTVASLPGGGATATGSYSKAITTTGALTNTVTSSTTTSGVTVKTASATVSGAFVALSGNHISILKTQTSANPTASSDAIDYLITVTNTGATTLTNVTVSEQPGVTLGTCPTVASLASGASFTCTAQYLVTPAAVLAQLYANTASVVTAEITTPVTSTVSTPIIAPPAVPAWSVSKTQTSTNPVSAIGDTITYEITVANTGNVALTAVTVTDANAAIVSCVAASGSDLAVGASMVCQAVHTVDATDLANHHVDNVAVASTTYPSFGPTNSNTVTTNVGSPSLSWTIVKTKTSTNTLAAAGDVITYNITVTNTGTGAITGVTISDTNAIIGTCDQTNGGDLAIGDSITCSASHAVTSAEVTAGQTVNFATASSTSSLGSSNSNTVTTPITPAAPPAPAGPSSYSSLSITKALTGTAPTKVGDIATYSIVVSNSGNTDLTGVTVTDANAVLGTCTVTLPATLAVGATFTCSATHVITLADMNAGFVKNVAVASATGANSATSTSNEVYTPLAQVKALTIGKYEIPVVKYVQGDSIKYLIVVRNTGNVTVTGVTIEDANATLGTCTPALPVAALEPGQSITCTAAHVLTAADFTAGQVLNVALVKTNDGSVQKSSNEVKTVLAEIKSLTITKEVIGDATYGLGDAVKYRIVAKNTGNVVLNDVVVADNNATITSCTPSVPAANLGVNETITCYATHIVTKADVTAGKVINIATAKTSTLEVSSEAGVTNPDHTNAGTPGATPGEIPSNAVVIKIRRANIAGTDAAALKNTKRKALAYTGDEPASQTSPWSPAALVILGALSLALIARRKITN